MANMEFDCDCGKHNKIKIGHIYIGEGICIQILNVVKEVLPIK